MFLEIAEFLNIPPSLAEKLIYTGSALIVLFLFKILTTSMVCRKVEDDKRRYHIRKTITYTYGIFLVIAVGSIWIKGMASIGTFLGLASAGLAVALHDTIANMAGFFFIESRKPFRVGDRIEIEGITGDVIDIRLFQFSVVEVGNWVDADQSTGRIIHVPNSMAMRIPLANSHVGFEYIWNEIPVLITFESDWKRAKSLLLDIGQKNAEFLSQNAQKQIRQAARRYLIVAGKLTPTVYTTVKDSGVMLTIRYLVDPRQRRGTEQKMWEDILDAFAQEDQVELAYNTIRYFKGSETTESPS